MVRMDLSNPKQTWPTPGSYLSDQTFVFTTRLIKRLPSLYCFHGREKERLDEGEFSFVGVCTTICGHEW